jgi:hypothetical protein
MQIVVGRWRSAKGLIPGGKDIVEERERDEDGKMKEGREKAKKVKRSK